MQAAQDQMPALTGGEAWTMVLRQLMGPRTSRKDRSEWLDAFFIDALDRMMHRLRARMQAVRATHQANDFMFLTDDDLMQDPVLRQEQERADAMQEVYNAVNLLLANNNKPRPPYRKKHLEDAYRLLVRVCKDHADPLPEDCVQ